ncbi:hypothetical protein NLI96_g9616 [Meripilus lineatus]|uniref:Uncharacterized protein n=1 Tax=Meripilus lineatus TaxID=2056292 RepID=A0AAD5UXD1_9APHY|nr:hypothetical protein NLI96_g9616 [Physisporinus lineatus]
MKALVETIELAVPLSSKPLKVVSIQDVVWAGERMLEATLSPNQCPPVLIYFPSGTSRPSSSLSRFQGMLGMMEVAAEAGINTPTVLYCRRPPSLDVGRAMVMFLKDTKAQPLMEIWPRLCKTRKEAVIKELASVMLKLYRYNIGSICTTRKVHVKGLPTRDNSGLSIPCFFQGPLASVPPLTACPVSLLYFQTLATQTQILMDIAERNPNAFLSFWPSIDPQALNQDERKAIRDTWTKLYDLATYHCLPVYATRPVVGQQAADYADKLFLKQSTGIYHDLDLPRLLVSFEGGNAKIIIGSGWEYSYHAPHWSVSRMPSWLIPEFSGPRMPPFTEQERLDICDSIYGHIQKESRDWIICYAFGIPNRYFEDCLKSFWTSRKSVERRLKLLEECWRRDHPLPWPVTEQGTAVNASHYAEWALESFLKHPRFLAVRDIWGDLRVAPTSEILTNADGSINTELLDELSPYLDKAAIGELLQGTQHGHCGLS